MPPSVGVEMEQEIKEERHEEKIEIDEASQQESTTASDGTDDPLDVSEGGLKIPVGESVKNAVKKIDDARVSVFSDAIISGQPRAVELIFDLVVQLFGNKTHMVRDASRMPCFR